MNDREEHERTRQHRRLRMRRRGRKAYIRSVYFLPSMATLGNAICGFGSMYVATLQGGSRDRLTNWLFEHNFFVAAILIFVAMLFDALDGRLARFARHTTDFGGQLDSLADVISFGAAPAFLSLQLFKDFHPNDLPAPLSRLIWACGAVYMCCAAIRLARFNVSNEHGEQHHFSFLGLPSPGAGGAVAAFVLMQQELVSRAKAAGETTLGNTYSTLASICIWLLPPLVLGMGLLMVSQIRYPHIVNRYLRGRRPIGPGLIGLVIVIILLGTFPWYMLGVASVTYALWGFVAWAANRLRPKKLPTEPTLSI